MKLYPNGRYTEPAKKNALHSLYGEGHVNATRTRECVAMPGHREQSILTPQCIWDGLKTFWPEGVAMDPCSNPEQIGFAVRYAVDGLAVPWPLRTYCNPPYGELKRWLEHGRKFDEVVWLVPMRCHRVWFREWYQTLNAVLALNPLKFHGFKQAYPAPLILGYHGRRIMDFLDAFEELGGSI